MAYRLKDYRESLIDAVTVVMRNSGGKVLPLTEVVELVRRRRHIEHPESVRGALTKLRDKGLVERVKRGHWRWIGEDNEQDTKI